MIVIYYNHAKKKLKNHDLGRWCAHDVHAAGVVQLRGKPRLERRDLRVPLVENLFQFKCLGRKISTSSKYLH